MERIESQLKAFRRGLRLPFEDGFGILAYVKTKLYHHHQIQTNEHVQGCQQQVDHLLVNFNNFRKQFIDEQSVELSPNGVALPHLDQLYNLKQLLDNVNGRIDGCLGMKNQTENDVRVYVSGLRPQDAEAHKVRLEELEADSRAMKADFDVICERLEQAIVAADLFLLQGLGIFGEGVECIAREE